MSSKWVAKLKGHDSDMAMDVINALGITKTEFANKAIMLLVQDISRQATAKMEELQKYEADKQTDENSEENSQGNTEAQE